MLVSSNTTMKEMEVSMKTESKICQKKTYHKQTTILQRKVGKCKFERFGSTKFKQILKIRTKNQIRLVEIENVVWGSVKRT